MSSLSGNIQSDIHDWIPFRSYRKGTEIIFPDATIRTVVTSFRSTNDSNADIAAFMSAPKGGAPGGSASKAYYEDPVQDQTELTALLEASLTDKQQRLVEDEGVPYRYDAESTGTEVGALPPDDQTGGTGFWIPITEDAAAIKAKYESNLDTNEFDDAEQAKLAAISDNWREPVLHVNQLTSLGISAGIIANISGNMADGDFFTLKNDGLTETFTFKAAPTVPFEIQAGGGASTQAQAIVDQINADSLKWSAVKIDTTRITIYRTAFFPMVEENERIFGVIQFGATTFQIIDHAGGEYSVAPGLFANMVAADPVSSNFGFFATLASFQSGEVRATFAGAAGIYLWNPNSNAWELVFAGVSQDEQDALENAPNALTGANPVADVAYVDGLIDSTIKPQEAYDPTITSAYPTTYGGNPVKKGDSFRLTAAGTMGAGATIVNPEDLTIALIDTPGDTPTNWHEIESNRDQATETVKGVAEIATQGETDTGTDDTKIVTPKKLEDTDLSGRDLTAIHDNALGEIVAVTEKTDTIGDDVLLIEDSEAGNAKKKVKVSTLIANKLGWADSPTGNGILRLLGWHILTDAAASLTSAAPVTVGKPGYHSHFVVDLSAAVGAPFTLRITGRSVNESTGATTPGDTEDIAVTANGYYQSTKSWIDAVQYSIVEGSKSCTIDVYRTSYWDNGNKNFEIEGARLEWTPDIGGWSIQLKIYHVQEDGSFVLIDDVTFASTDTPLRAGNGDIGRYKRLDYATTILGSGKEGIAVLLDQTGIESYYLDIKYC